MLGWELPPHNSGGLGVACYNLSKALAGQGVEIDFVVPYASTHEEIKFMNVISATKLDPLFRYGGGAYESARVEEDIIYDTATDQKMSLRDVQRNYCRFIEEYLEKCKELGFPDAIHAHDWLTFEAGMLAKKKYGLPFIAHVHATEYDRSGMRGGNPLIHAIESEALMMADKIIAVSEATKRIIHEKYHIPLDRIEVAYNSLGDDFLGSDYRYDENEYKYLENLRARGYTIVATLGRLTIQKGLWHLLHAAKLALEHNSKLMFVLAGDGEDRDDLLELAANLGIIDNIIFTGWVMGKRRRDIYSVSDIFVMSSISEPFGLTALEAAHHSNALIITKQSGVAEVLHAAMVYDFWDEQKLADSILAIAQSKGLKRELRQGVQHEYRRISWDDVARKCVQVYNKVKRTRHHRHYYHGKHR